MNLKRCEKGHYYDVDKHNECPHCKNKVNIVTDNNIVGGIVMHKCMWCGAENALHYSEKICPSCHNNLDGSHNDFINTSLSHFELGNRYYKNRNLIKLRKNF